MLFTFQLIKSFQTLEPENIGTPKKTKLNGQDDKLSDPSQNQQIEENDDDDLFEVSSTTQTHGLSIC